MSNEINLGAVVVAASVESQNQEIIHLNVSGHKMEISKSTLIQMDFFKSYLTWNSNGRNEKSLFDDFDPYLFLKLLNKIRLPELEIDSATLLAAKYFGLPISSTQSNPKKSVFVMHQVTLTRDNSFYIY